MQTSNPRPNSKTLPKFAAAAGITLLLMTPLTASADHERHDIVQALAGAAVVYLLIDSLEDDHRHIRDHRERRHHHRYRAHHRDHWKHAKHKRQHREHHRHNRYDRHRGYHWERQRRYYDQ